MSAGVDPISKKPLSHFNPGALVMSIAAAGCNFRCQFCDNWMISQDREVAGRNFPPGDVVKAAREGSLHVHAWYYEIATGTVHRYNPVKEQFEPIREEE